MIEKAYDNLIHILRKFTNNTNRINEDDIKQQYSDTQRWRVVVLDE